MGAVEPELGSGQHAAAGQFAVQRNWHGADGAFVRRFGVVLYARSAAEYLAGGRAADAMSVSQSLIELCCEMKCRTGAGYIWRYTKEDKIAPVSKIVQPSKWLPVDQFDLSGNFIKTYPCAQVASDETGVPLTSIRHTLYGDSKTAYGYVFRYTSERKEDKNCEKM